MNIQAQRKNAERELRFWEKEMNKPVEERDLDKLKAINLINAQRVIKIADEILPQITKEEWDRIQSGVHGLNDREQLMPCKDIKKKYGLSWSELEAIRSSTRETPQARYDRFNTQRVYIKLNKNTDADILRKLANVDNKQGYIKQLIRKDINGE